MSYIDEVRDQLSLKVQEHFALTEREAELAGMGYTKQPNVLRERVSERQYVSRRLNILNCEMMELIHAYNAEKEKDLERESNRPTPREVTAPTAA